MSVDKKQVAMWAAGILASAAVAFLIYRLQSNDAAQAAANEADASEESESELANQQQEVASLPSISVPTIASTPSTTPSTTDTTNQGTSPATDDDLESIIAAFQGSDQSGVTNATTPIAALPYPTAPSIPAVATPTLIDYSGGSSSSGGSSNPTVVKSANGLNTNLISA